VFISLYRLSLWYNGHMIHPLDDCRTSDSRFSWHYTHYKLDYCYLLLLLNYYLAESQMCCDLLITRPSIRSSLHMTFLLCLSHDFWVEWWTSSSAVVIYVWRQPNDRCQSWRCWQRCVTWKGAGSRIEAKTLTLPTKTTPRSVVVQCGYALYFF